MTTATAREGAAATRSDTAHGEPLRLQLRIGSTLYRVSAFSSPTATETPEQKLFRLIEREVQAND